jgi:predicted dehydrogenase
MEPLNLILVGCGMMGNRHLRGYAELERVRPGSLRLLGVCDLDRKNADATAADATQLLGYTPAVYTTPEEALEAERAIEAADVVTGNLTHDPVAIPLLEAGIDIQIEKPLGATIARGRAIIDAVERTGRILAVAENNRRDPMNRLLTHIVQNGYIGQPNFALQIQLSTNRNVCATPWRHTIANGGLLLDIGIHQAYMLEMVLGPINTVYGRSQRVWPRRQWTYPDGRVEDLEVESDDVFTITLEFANGVQGTWTLYFGTVGGGQWQRTICGDQGMVDGPPDRSGQAVRLRRDGETLEGDALIASLPDFHLNDIETRLFGERPSSYHFGGDTDRKLIAAELADFIDAVRQQRPPEVPATLGLRAVAVIYAIWESIHSSNPVRVEDVLSGKIHSFQDEVERAAQQ